MGLNLNRNIYLEHFFIVNYLKCVHHEYIDTNLNIDPVML